jgi:hypothetical protein
LAALKKAIVFKGELAGHETDRVLSIAALIESFCHDTVPEA